MVKSNIVLSPSHSGRLRVKSWLFLINSSILALQKSCTFGIVSDSLHYEFKLQLATICKIPVSLYQGKFTTDKKLTVGYSIPDEIPTTCLQLCELV